jgi:hypothetical protein
MAAASMTVGLISDTHGLLREEALDVLRRSDLIIHAGDVGKPEILDILNQIAPVTAVRGNIDHGEWAEALPETQVVTADSAIIYVLHDLAQLDCDPAAAGFHIVVTGHSHKPGTFERNGVLFINPGSAGPRRFKLPISVAYLDVGKKPWEPNFIDLSSYQALSF